MLDFLADGLDPRAVARRSARVLASLLKLQLADTPPLADPTYELIAPTYRMLVTAIGHLPPADLRVAARRLIANSECPTAVIVFHPPWDSPWRWDTKAYVAWAHDGSVLAADMAEAAMGLDVGCAAFLAADGGRFLQVMRDGWLVRTEPDSEEWRLARLGATGVWQHDIVPDAEAA
jgi:hypothetical protein